MLEVLKIYASNVLKIEAITAASNNFSLLDLAEHNQLADENFGVRSDTWECLAKLEKEHKLKFFFTAVRKFYLASITKMLKKFPFGDSL